MFPEESSPRALMCILRLLKSPIIRTKHCNSVSVFRKASLYVDINIFVIDNSSERYVTTEEGFLTITTRAEKTFWKDWDNHKLSFVENSKNYTSGMIQSWNKFCFTGGVLEMSVQLPGGSADASGLWPAAWLMGNLGRATFPETTTNVWPWSYDTCGVVTDINKKQEINACNSDKLSPKYGMHPNQGRGAPEIDIFEIMTGHEMPKVPLGVNPATMNPPFDYEHIPALLITSLQVAPGISSLQRPRNGIPLNMNKSAVWYPDLHLSTATELNSACYGEAAGRIGDSYMEDSISAKTKLSDSYFTTPHTYRLEWQPGRDGYLHWYLDSTFIFGIEEATLRKSTGAIIPEEPSYIILNTALSHNWGFPEPCDGVGNPTCKACWHCYDCTNPECQCSLPEAMRRCKILPAVMKVDYIRLYQDLDDPLHSLGCSPLSHPTAQYISSFSERYADWAPATTAGWRSYTVLVILVHFLVIIILILSLIFSCLYLCNPTYRTIGDVKSSLSAPTSCSSSPSSKSAHLSSRGQKSEISKHATNGNVSETTGLLSATA